MNIDFASFGLRPTLLQALADLKHECPTPVQEAVIPHMLEGRDVIAQARTGTGKTAAFALPALQRLNPKGKGVQVLVLSPTRELAVQVGKAMEDYSAHESAKILTIYGGASYGYQKGTLRQGASVVVGTPGRLLDLVRQGNLKLDTVRLLVLDEADEMLSMGFAEELEEIVAALPQERQTALFSATIPQEIERLVKKATVNAVRVNLSKELSTKSVTLTCYMVKESDKIAAVTRLFETEEVEAALIFCRTRAQTGHLASELTSRGIAAEALSGAMEQDSREQVLKRFRSEGFRVLVATDVAARGLDIDHLSHVVNLDLPQSPDTFVHRIGRVGRAGRTGVAITLITPKERWKLQRIERALKRSIEERKIPTKKEIARRRLEALYAKMHKWLESDRCGKEMAAVEELTKAGYSLKTIAAAALKLATASEKGRPIAEMSEEVFEERPAAKGRGREHSKDRTRDKKSRGKGEQVQTDGLIQLMAGVGKAHGVSPKEIVGILTKQAKVPNKVIGNIRITKTRSFVDLPPEFVSRVVKNNGSYRAGKRSFTFEPS